MDISLSADAIIDLNRLLKEVPVDKEFRVSNLIKDSDDTSFLDKAKIAWEINNFLIQQGFADRTGSAVLLREGVTPDMILTPDKGRSLRAAGSYEQYYSQSNTENRKIDKENSQNRIMESLTGIIALWTLVAGINYTIDILKYVVPEFGNCACYKRIIITIISLTFGLWSYRSLNIPLKYLSKRTQEK
jgi:hypothetical protein